jgi:hypothetical protein
MLGVIRKRDVVLNPVATIQSFGWRVFFRALTAGPQETFLSLVAEAEGRDQGRRAPELIDRAIALELRAMRIYEALAQRHAAHPDARQLFATLALQERQHADLLRVCRLAARRAPLDARALVRFAGVMPGLEAAMDGAESSARAEGLADPLREALRTTIALESSEVNRVFDGLVSASSSDFVRTLAAFRTATRAHLRYLRKAVPRLDPSLEGECGSLLCEPQAA